MRVELVDSAIFIPFYTSIIAVQAKYFLSADFLPSLLLTQLELNPGILG